MRQKDKDVHEWEPMADFWRDQEASRHLPTLCALARKLLSTPG